MRSVATPYPPVFNNRWNFNTIVCRRCRLESVVPRPTLLWSSTARNNVADGSLVFTGLLRRLRSAERCVLPPSRKLQKEWNIRRRDWKLRVITEGVCVSLWA